MLLTADGVELRPIPSSPSDDYMAGADGKIYSRKRYMGFGKTVYGDWRPLIGTPGSKGYLLVSLSHQNKRVTRSVHTLICEAWWGPRPHPAFQVRHLDGSKDNTLPDNLKWGSQAANWADRKAHGRGMGEQHHSAKLTDFERKALRWALAKGLCSQRNAARVLGLSNGAVSAIYPGKRKPFSG